MKNTNLESHTPTQCKEIVKDIAVIIPAYNEDRSIRAITQKILQHVSNVIVVDDGSDDSTIEELNGLPITLLRNEKNQGKAASLLLGFKSLNKQQHITGVITIDADNQHDPNDIPNFIIATRQNPQHIIIGARLINAENAPKIRLAANKMADFFISWAAGHRVIDSQSGYRLYPTALIRECINGQSLKGNFTFESEVLINCTRQGYIPVSIPIASYYPEDARKSYYRPYTDTLKITRMILWKIISRGFCIRGLWRTLKKKTHTIANS